MGFPPSDPTEAGANRRGATFPHRATRRKIANPPGIRYPFATWKLELRAWSIVGAPTWGPESSVLPLAPAPRRRHISHRDLPLVTIRGVENLMEMVDTHYGRHDLGVAMRRKSNLDQRKRINGDAERKYAMRYKVTSEASQRHIPGRWLLNTARDRIF